MRLRLATLLLPLALTGCGLQPLYQGGAHGQVAQTLAGVEVEDIGGQDGWLMRNALQQRLGAMGHDEAPRYKLVVELDDKITGMGIRADNDAVTRERRTIRARFRLVTADVEGTTLVDASAGSDEGIDVVGSPYATVAGEQTALENVVQDVADQIVARLAVFARRNQGR